VCTSVNSLISVTLSVAAVNTCSTVCIFYTPNLDFNSSTSAESSCTALISIGIKAPSAKFCMPSGDSLQIACPFCISGWLSITFLTSCAINPCKLYFPFLELVDLSQDYKEFG
jgi:hypothetical protein